MNSEEGGQACHFNGEPRVSPRGSDERPDEQREPSEGEERAALGGRQCPVTTPPAIRFSKIGSTSQFNSVLEVHELIHGHVRQRDADRHLLRLRLTHRRAPRKRDDDCACSQSMISSGDRCGAAKGHRQGPSPLHDLIELWRSPVTHCRSRSRRVARGAASRRPVAPFRWEPSTSRSDCCCP